MGCAKCGGGRTGKKCCLCSKDKALEKFKWGTSRLICRRCKDRMEKQMIEQEIMILRTRTLLSGKDFNVKDLKKWKKYWYAKSVEKI